MFEVCLLGTGGMMPMPDRALTALMTRYGGRCILIDSGEGTQVGIMRKKGFSMQKLDAILLTHLHADHVAGLPGLLLTASSYGRTEPLLIVGPEGTEQTLACLLTVAPDIGFPIEYRELTGEEESFFVGEVKITAFRVDHRVTCYGYTMDVARRARFIPELADALGVPPAMRGLLQSGKSIEIDGRTVTPEDVMPLPRRGIRVTYTTDTRPTESIVKNARGADLFVCEGIYADPEKLQKAISYKHMLFSEAAELARAAEVSELWLTHFSPSLEHPEEFIENASSIFERTVCPTDGEYIDIDFKDDAP